MVSHLRRSRHREGMRLAWVSLALLLSGCAALPLLIPPPAAKGSETSLPVAASDPAPRQTLTVTVGPTAPSNSGTTLGPLGRRWESYAPSTEPT